MVGKCWNAYVSLTLPFSLLVFLFSSHSCCCCELGVPYTVMREQLQAEDEGCVGGVWRAG